MTRRPAADGKPCKVCNAEAGQVLGLSPFGSLVCGGIAVGGQCEPACGSDAGADSPR